MTDREVRCVACLVAVRRSERDVCCITPMRMTAQQWAGATLSPPTCDREQSASLLADV